MKALYIHVPFCSSICSYCDFKRSLYNEKIVDAWLDRVIDDICQIQEDIKTIYIGGGTPTSLHERQLEKLLQAIYPYTKHCLEYTIESNIESLTDEKLVLMKQYGVNRISLGVQSFQDNVLALYNRKHRRQDIEPCLERIKQHGIDNISIDLIYGVDIQTLDMWMEDLKCAVCLPYVKHISIYSLTIEENSVFGKQNRDTVDNEIEARMYEVAISYLEKHGFDRYEVANFAKEGYASKHNRQYWEYNDFIGIGVGASGKENHVRYSLQGSIKEYIDRKENREEEMLSLEDEMFEWIMMGLRLKEGVSFDIFEKRYKIKFIEHYKVALQKAIDAEYITLTKDGMKTTEKGLFYLHDVLLLFME